MGDDVKKILAHATVSVGHAGVAPPPQVLVCPTCAARQEKPREFTCPYCGGALFEEQA